MIKTVLALVTVAVVSACSASTEVQTPVVIDRGETVCDVLKRPMDNHMSAVIDNGRVMIDNGAKEVVVTASELSDVYKTGCK